MADTYETIECPACGKRMKKIFVPSAGVNIDICTEGCGGMFFDNREFEKFDEQTENIEEILKEIEGKTFEKVDESEDRFCPACGAKMVKNYSSVKREISVDECYTCGGKFLDNGELRKIRDEYRTAEERGQDVVDNMFAIAQGSELSLSEIAYLRGVSEKRLDETSLSRSFRLQKKMNKRSRSLLGSLFNKIIGI